MSAAIQAEGAHRKSRSRRSARSPGIKRPRTRVREEDHPQDGLRAVHMTIQAESAWEVQRARYARDDSGREHVTQIGLETFKVHRTNVAIPACLSLMRFVTPNSRQGSGCQDNVPATAPV